nr:cupredoxin domain-containing protein [Streptomyces sp. ISL-100]
MSATDFGVLIGAAGLIALLAWFFLGPKKTRVAELQGGVQEIGITVKGGYSPNLIRVRQGIPVRLIFDRRESGECTSRVLFPDFALAKSLPAFGKATAEFVPHKAGRFGFACGMNMVHGTLIVEPTDDGRATTREPAAGEEEQPAETAVPGGAGAEDGEAAARRAEIADLSRRVILGAILSAPVVVVVMLHELFAVAVPDVLLNHWVQFALITPVMFYTGWPIHRTGWLALRHRSAEMNALITLGTSAAYGYSLLVTVVPGLLPAEVRDVYYEAVGVILTLILLGRLVEAKAKAGTGQAMRELLNLQAKTARVVRDDAEVEGAGR